MFKTVFIGDLAPGVTTQGRGWQSYTVVAAVVAEVEVVV